MNFLKRRKRSAHKGDFGHLLVLAGSLGYTGAAVLASQAALLSGSGLVTLGIPESLNRIVARKLTEVITLPLPETRAKSFSLKSLKAVLRKIEEVDAVAMGPGLSQHAETVAWVHRLLPHLEKPTVIDADGLNAVARNPQILEKVKVPLVVTPHPGEMGRLIRKQSRYVQEHRETVARDFSLRYNIITVLKGHRTLVTSSKGKRYLNRTGNPGMATAGCGDVLTGIVGSFLGQGMAPFEAACRAVYVHGLAGDLAAREKGETSLVASDLLKFLPAAFKKVVR